MTTPSGDVAIGANVSATVTSGLPSPVNRAVFSTPAMRQLAEAMTEPPDPGSVNRRWGIIAAYNGPPNYTVDVTIGGVLVPDLAYDAAYTPTVGEVVMLDVVGSDTVVIGTTAPGRWRTGEIEATFLPTAKAGALFCQGQSISRTAYANLWSWVTANALNGTGKPFGNGNGSTTFTLPDLRGLVPIGAGTRGTDTYAVGDQPGAARVTLATNQMPAHNHSVSATTTTTTAATGAHSHGGGTGLQSNDHSHAFDVKPAVWESSGYGLATGQPGFTDRVMVTATPPNGMATYGTNSNHTHAVSSDGTHSHTATSTTNITQSTVGGTTPVDVRQPAFVVNWLIYV